MWSQIWGGGQGSKYVIQERVENEHGVEFKGIRSLINRVAENKKNN